MSDNIDPNTPTAWRFWSPKPLNEYENHEDAPYILEYLRYCLKQLEAPWVQYTTTSPSPSDMQSSVEPGGGLGDGPMSPDNDFWRASRPQESGIDDQVEMEYSSRVEDLANGLDSRQTQLVWGLIDGISGFLAQRLHGTIGTIGTAPTAKTEAVKPEPREGGHTSSGPCSASIPPVLLPDSCDSSPLISRCISCATSPKENKSDTELSDAADDDASEIEGSVTRRAKDLDPSDWSAHAVAQEKERFMHEKLVDEGTGKPGHPDADTYKLAADAYATMVRDLGNSDLPERRTPVLPSCPGFRDYQVAVSQYVDPRVLFKRELAELERGRRPRRKMRHR